MSNVLAVFKADLAAAGFNQAYISYCEEKYNAGLFDYNPETQQIELTEKAKQLGYSLRSSKR